jgi:two-component system response regulator VanR
MEKKQSILVVDDEKDIREVIEIYLMNENFNVITACDGLEALEKIKNKDISG